MNILAIMGGARYDAITERVIADAPKFGADRVLVYDDVWVEAHPFRKLNAWLWDHPGDKNGKRGFGWYAFKPLVIIDAFEKASAGDVVLYLDGDSCPVSSMLPIFDTAQREGAMLFASQGHSQAAWCTRDCFEVMGQAWGKGMKAYGRDFTSMQAGCARFFAMKKGPWRVRQFLAEWMTYTVNPMATTFDPSTLGPERIEFQEHRTEQAIMTNLAHRYGLKLWRECDDSGEGWDVDRDVMPVAIFQQTRVGGGNIPGGSRFRNVEMP